MIKRVDLTDKGKGIVYRAYAGPFATNEQASRVCTDLKAAGLSDCYIHKN
ncbi:MAG: SPOR domain-containing protein [Bradyrhizobium sp.]